MVRTYKGDGSGCRFSVDTPLMCDEPGSGRLRGASGIDTEDDIAPEVLLIPFSRMLFGNARTPPGTPRITSSQFEWKRC